MIKVTPKPMPMPLPRLPKPLPKLPLPKPIPRCPPPLWPPPVKGTTLNLGDRLNATRLDDALSGPLVRMREALAKAGTATVRRGLDGQVRGPEGQPLATVRTKDGRTLYVDPNTNQYYVAQPRPFGLKSQLGSETVRGPYELPKDAQFSNSHFSDADVRELTRLARGGSVFEHKPSPRPVLF